MFNSKIDVVMVAATLFSERGYHGTTMREIARSLDIQEGSLYSHVASKHELLWEIVYRAATLFLSQARTIPHTLPAEEQVRQLVRKHLEVIALERAYATVFFREWTMLEAEQQQKIMRLRDAYEAHFRQVIALGVQEGSFRVTNPHIASLFALSALNWTYQWLDSSGPLSISRLGDTYCALILHALKDGADCRAR